MNRACFFPLRTNAAYFHERGSLDLKRRLKEASLLFDEVIVEDGHYLAAVGERSSFEVFQPATDENIADKTVLPTRGGKFTVAISRDDTGPMRAIIDEPATRRFVSEYRSITQEIREESGLTNLPEWFRVEGYEAAPRVKAEIGRIAQEDAKRPGFWRRKQGDPLRKLVLQALNYDLGLSTALQLPISSDGYFAPLVLRKPETTPVHSGALVLRVEVPYFAELTWPQILELRDSPGIKDFRSKLREIQEEEIEKAASTDDVRQRVQRRITYDLAKEAQPAGGFETGARMSLNVMLGIMSGGLSTAAGALLDYREWDIKRSSWVTVYFRLREFEQRN
jgi:hypothetical protein